MTPLSHTVSAYMCMCVCVFRSKITPVLEDMCVFEYWISFLEAKPLKNNNAKHIWFNNLKKA